MRKDTEKEKKSNHHLSSEGGDCFAVVGCPVMHSKSPLMFNAVFETQIQQNTNCYSRLAASTAKEAIFLFNELKLRGMNVTAPFKKDVMPHLDDIEPAAIEIGGVNTIVRESNQLKGYNTDYHGVVESFSQNNISLKGRKCIVLGAGGAGRAAVYGLAREKARVIIINRTFKKAQEVAEQFNVQAEKIEELEELLKTADILVSTLSADIDIIPVEWFHPNLVIFDANYKKSFLSEKGKEKGCQILKGEEWLLNQAIPAYTHFLTKIPDSNEIKIMKNALSSPSLLKPKNIALVGFMGCGKTTIGKILAEKLGLIFKDLDSLIEKEEGRSIPDIFKDSGESYFRRVEKEILKRELMNHSGIVYGCGGGIVVDDENKELLKNHSLVIWLYSKPETILKRIPPGTRPLLSGPAPLRKAQKLLNLRLNHYARTSDIIFSSEISAEETVGKIYEEINKTFND